MTGNAFYFNLQNSQIDKLNSELGKQLSRQEIQDMAKNYLLKFAENQKLIGDMSPTDKKLHLMNLLTQLKIWHELKDLRFTIPQSADILAGRKTISQVVDENKVIEKTGFNCGSCGHEHFGDDHPTKKLYCKEISCYCGIRGQ